MGRWKSFKKQLFKLKKNRQKEKINSIQNNKRRVLLFWGEFYNYYYREKRFLFCNRGSSFILCRLIVIRGWNSTIIVLSCF